MSPAGSAGSWFHRPLFENPVWLWGAAVATGLGILAVTLMTRRWFVKSTARDTEPSGPLEIGAAVLRRTHPLFLLALAVLGGSFVLELGPRAAVLRRIIGAASLVQAGLWGNALLAALLLRWARARAGQSGAPAAMAAIGFVSRLVLWSVVLLLALDNLGLKVTALLAGLGVGGIAVALAVQNILGDLFSSFSILLDRPFEHGDFIVVGDLMGTVEQIGLKTTRVRSLFGEEIVFSNSDLLSSRIRNFKRMKERRVVFRLGVTYGTPVAKLEALPALLRGAVESSGADRVRFDRAHFQEYGDYSLLFEVVYYVLSADYNQHMDLRQAINLEIYRRFEKEGLEFAFPTQSLLVSRATPPRAS